ncbi:MAG: M28 family peptidase [Myxococcota bacterium]
MVGTAATARGGARALLVACLLLDACAAPARPPQEGLAPAAECFERIVTVLSHDDMQGRGIGTEGLERAASFLEGEFAALGLQRHRGGYRQPFATLTGVELGAENALRWNGGEGRIGRDFTPLGFSSAGAFEGPLVFAGYGTRAESIGYDDYADLDVAGKVVLAWRFEPGERDPDSPFDGTRPTRWSDLRYKALVAREAGAAALILVAPPGDEDDRLPTLRASGPVPPAGLPVLQVSRALAERWLASAGADPGELHAAIDSDYRPRSLEVPSVEIRGRVDLVTTRASVANVLGVLPGRGRLAREAVVVGAHYDHLGMRGAGSLRPRSGAVHNGADDNASGVAAMVCGVGGLARELWTRADARRTLVVVAFTAEEVGLAGSSHYVRHPARPVEDTVAMVNLDMVGRLRDDKLWGLGTDSAPEWVALLERLATEAGLELVPGGDGYGPSDQLPFYERGVPVVHLFTGGHSEYHTPDDDADTVNVKGGARVSAYLQSVLGDLLARAEPLTYQVSSSAPRLVGDSRGYGAYLGTIPDFAEMMGDAGVLLSGVREGGPADLAGLRGGDRIVGMAGVEIRNLYDMTFVLREQRPGELIQIELLRGDERITVRAKLDRRGGGDARGSPAPVDEASDPGTWAPSAGKDAGSLLDPREVRLADLRQLTFGGENAEAYFSPDGRKLVFQRTPPEGGCDQQYVLDLSTGSMTRLSSGRGRTTCGYYAYPDGERLIYATTEAEGRECPPPPDRSRGYVWALYEYDLVWQSGPHAPAEPFLPHSGYDAEATVCMADGRIVFTSTREGDLDLFAVNPDGTGLVRLTDTPGYDGGAFFTPDCSAIVWRASRPRGQALEDYRALLEGGLVRPSALEIFWMEADGSNVRQLTRNGRANFGPSPLPDASGAIFSSNAGGSEREFDLFTVGLDGGTPERITYTPGFDGFPMFSPDGRWLVFASNRAGPEGSTNLFIARWVMESADRDTGDGAALDEEPPSH